MKIRVTCTGCRASFLATDEQLGQPVSCPKCGLTSRLPGTMAEVARLASASPSSPDQGPAVPDAPPRPTSVFVADEAEEAHPRRPRRLVPFALGVLGGLGVAILILLPLLRRPEPVEEAAPTPIDPAERTARQFLDALVSGDSDAIDRLSTVVDPPAIASFKDARRDPDGDETLRGSFAPIAALHEQIASTYTYDPAIDRFQNANPLGVAADFMDEADRLREENEAGDVYSRIAGGSADEQLDAAIEYAESFAKLTREVLPRKELVPTYAQLVRDAEPPLPPDAEALALRFGEDEQTWDDLLGRPFFTVEADGPFVLEQAEVVATVRDRLASPGEPARRLRLRLVRFRLDAIDTGWEVVSARREQDEPPPETPEPYSSPGLESGP